jgi:hypothetical protein
MEVVHLINITSFTVSTTQNLVSLTTDSATLSKVESNKANHIRMSPIVGFHIISFIWDQLAALAL